MADLKSKTEDAMNESRIMILGGQVLIGSAYRLFFMHDFQTVSPKLQLLLTGGLGAMLLVFGALLLPAAYHQITERGVDSVDVILIANGMTRCTLIVFAAALASFLAFAFDRVLGTAASIAAALFTFVSAVSLWYIVPISAKDQAHRHDRRLELEKQQQSESKEKKRMTSLDEKIKTALIECRMVLPGAQALLGFELVTMLEQGFSELPSIERIIHIAALLSIALATMTLMAPAAFHRLAEHGENTGRMYHFTSRMLLSSLVLLGLGISADFQVVLQKMTQSYPVSVSIAGCLLALFYLLWFGYTLWKRREIVTEAAS